MASCFAFDGSLMSNLFYRSVVHVDLQNKWTLAAKVFYSKP